MNAQIMVTLDDSEKDGRALAVALALATLTGAGIHLVQIVDAESEEGGTPASARAEHRLATVAKRLDTAAMASLTWAVIPSRHVADTLLRTAKADNTLLVVMGTRAPDSLRRAFIGSVADRVMRECQRPVVLVPPGAAFMAGKRVQLGRVLVPLDGSQLANRALEFVVRLPHARELEYVLLEVVPPTTADVRNAEAEENVSTPARVAEAEERLQSTAARIRERHATVVEVAVVESDRVGEAIASSVRECLVEMIAMSTRGASGLRRFAFGSIADEVVRTSEVPLLLLTPAMLATDS